MTRQLLWLAPLLVGALAGAARAQEPTRADLAHALRQAKAANPIAPSPGRVERVLTMLETGVMSRITAPPDGFGVRVGGIDQGSGLVFGPSWRASNLWGGSLQLSASAARAITGDTGIDAGLVIAGVGTHRLVFGVDASAIRLAQERFFGIGRNSRRSDQTAFGVSRDEVVARATLAPTRWLRVAASGGALDTSTRAGRARAVPSIETRFAAVEATALGDSTRFSTVSLATTIDWRDVPGNPRGGGRYHLAVTRYADRDSARHSFTRVDAEVEQHVSGWQRQRLLTLRAMLAATVADPGQRVPFHLQPVLGGSRVLRGFVTDRFRDRNALALQAEYGWDLTPFLSAVAFAEGGTVAAAWRELNVNNLRTDYGLGLRFGSARHVSLRSDVAFGSGEGTRLTMRFDHAF